MSVARVCVPQSSPGKDKGKGPTSASPKLNSPSAGVSLGECPWSWQVGVPQPEPRVTPDGGIGRPGGARAGPTGVLLAPEDHKRQEVSSGARPETTPPAFPSLGASLPPGQQVDHCCSLLHRR